MTEYRGDFKMLNPIPVLTDEDGQFHCPMPMLQRTFADNDTATTKRVMCGEEMFVRWTLHCPVPDLNGNEAMTQQNSGEWAVAGHWELRCAHGHVLMTSADGDGWEDAQPFVTREAFGAIE